jgi:hypothetical protein
MPDKALILLLLSEEEALALDKIITVGRASFGDMFIYQIGTNILARLREDINKLKELNNANQNTSNQISE